MAFRLTSKYIIDRFKIYKVVWSGDNKDEAFSIGKCFKSKGIHGIIVGRGMGNPFSKRVEPKYTVAVISQSK
jgi:hypothetical protein